ncbi:unnamed protein product [Oppiella nova]|uniref:Uncharacterized protein n=1 Tax=Oppiella nova TaxID=334625 RepID=A0A7R9M5J6_9ACAR|nr:unnamed protein product [Oppiella nova]CAG2171171.1 unnamed protein product [Oppiella nova]
MPFSNMFVLRNRSCFRAPDHVIDEVKSVTQHLEISKSGNVYTIKTVSPNQTREIQFELGKEFDAQTLTGAKPSVVVLEGNRLIQTVKGEREITIVREFNGNELRVTTTSGPVVAVRTYTRQ